MLRRSSVRMLAMLVAFSGCGGGGGSTRDAAPLDDGGEGDVDAPEGGDADAGVDAPTDAGTFVPPAIDDQDGDGVPDSLDALPMNPAELFDDDMDGVGNAADADEDADGVDDELDAFPFDPLKTASPSTAEVEPNDRPTIATAVVAAPVRLTGTFAAGSDIDQFLMPLTAGTALSIVVTGSSRPDELEAELWQTTTRPLRAVVNDPTAGTLLVRSWVVPADGDYRVVLRARGQASAVSYVASVIHDSDLDGLADDDERARGLHPGRPDTDHDEVADRHESAWATGGDSDGIPAWLDADSDGDGILDRVEGPMDDDHDGLPTFIDLDADGSGANDATAVGANPLPLDSDRDGVPDYRSRDDDGDGILDANDAAPTAYAPAPTTLVIHDASTEIATSTIVPGTAIAGETLVLTGQGFSATTTENLVILAGGDRLWNLVPSAATATELRVIVPSGAGGRVRVATNGGVSAFVAVTSLRATDPVIYPVAAAVPYSTYFTVDGRNLGSVIVADHGGRHASVPAGDRAAASVALAVSTMRPAERLRVGTDTRWSNEILLPAVGPKYVAATFPTAAGIDPTTVTYASESATHTITAFGPTLQLSHSRPTMVLALAPVGVGATQCVTLQGHFLYYEDSMTLTTRTSVVSAALSGIWASGRVSRDSFVTLRDSIDALPETTAAAMALETALGTDPCVLATSSDATLRDAILDLVVAAEAEIRAGLQNATLSPSTLPFTTTNPTITPAQASDVLVRSIANGNVEIENDSQLYLSAQVTERASGRIVTTHVKSFFDLDMVGPQWGLFGAFNAQSTPLTTPAGRNATLEVVTPGVAGPAPSTAAAQDAQFYLRLRTTVDRIVIPVLSEVLGTSAVVQKDVILQLIIDQLYDVVQDVRSAFAAGNAEAAAKALVNGIVRDLENVGPLTQGLAKIFASAAPGAAARFGAMAIPLFGQVKALLDALGAIATATNVTKCVVDLASTPQTLPFEIDFGFELGQIDPPTIERAYRTTRLRVKGVGFRRFDPITGDPAPVLVTVIDTGGLVTSIKPIVERLAIDGSSFEIWLPGSFVANAKGPLQIKVKILEEELTWPMNVRILGGLELETITPPAGGPGDRITLHGTAFGTDVREARVWFSGLDGNGDPVKLRATTLAARGTEIDAIVPDGAVAGASWNVTVETGPTGLTFVSNVRPFNVQFGSLAGNWFFTFDVFPCYDPPRRWTFDVAWRDPEPWGDEPAIDHTGRGQGCGVSAQWIINPLDPDYGMLKIGQTGGIACEGGGYYGYLSPDGGHIEGIGRGSTTSEFQCGNTWPAPTVSGIRY